MNIPTDSPHRRYNPLDGGWVLVSPHRTARPWQGEETEVIDERPSYLANCYLCPGNTRAGGHKTPDYSGVYVFDNDFAALLPADATSEPLLVADSSNDGSQNSALFRAESASGCCRVICYSPTHNRSLGQLDSQALLGVINAWQQEYQSLSAQYVWVQIFENRGSAMGASNPHPHGQIWAVDHLPGIAAAEMQQQERYYKTHGTPLLLEYAQQEATAGTRVVYRNDEWLVVVPYWASWPFETLLLPVQHTPSLATLNERQQAQLAVALQRLQRGYDAMFGCEFPYSFGWHSAPGAQFVDCHTESFWQLHAHFYPPLLRSATVKKFMVGYEMLAEPQRDLTPELAATMLRDALAQVVLT